MAGKNMNHSGMKTRKLLHHLSVVGYRLESAPDSRKEARFFSQGFPRDDTWFARSKMEVGIVAHTCSILYHLLGSSTDSGCVAKSCKT